MALVRSRGAMLLADAGFDKRLRKTHEGCTDVRFEATAAVARSLLGWLARIGHRGRHRGALRGPSAWPHRSSWCGRLLRALGLSDGGSALHRETASQDLYKRRISRILPVFLVFTLTVYGLALLLGWSFTNAEFWATLLFLRTYVPMTPDIVRSAVPITHLWSLNVEEHAYVAMSALRLVELFKRRMDLVLLGIGTVAVLISLLYQMAGDAAPHWKEKGSEEACAPLMLAAGYRLWRARRPQSARPWLATVATVMALLPYLEATASLPSLAKLVLYYGAPFWFAVAVNHLSESVGPLRRIVSFRPLQFVGLWSYSIYLWQQPFYVHQHAIPGGPAIALALALLVSLASYYYLERPTRDWLNARW